MSFTGFTTDDPIKLPAELFEQVLPSIVQPSELKVTLHFFFLLRASRRRPRMVEWSDLRGDKTLRRSLRAVAPHRPFEEVLLEGLAATVHRGTLLHVTIPEGPRVGNWYLANTERNRSWVGRTVDGDIAWLPAPAPPQRPTIFTLYEHNIGVVTPMIAEELREAQDTYPAAWLEDAMREAVRSNKRSWRYVRAVLGRWSRDGRDGGLPGADPAPEKYISGHLSDIVKY